VNLSSFAGNMFKNFVSKYNSCIHHFSVDKKELIMVVTNCAVATRDRTGIPFSEFFGTEPHRDSRFWIPDDPVSKKFEKKSRPENPD
jgi:hypothetical protein